METNLRAAIMKIFRTLDAINIMFTSDIVNTDIGKFSIILNGCQLETDNYRILISALSSSIRVWRSSDCIGSENCVHRFYHLHSDIASEIIKDTPEVIYPLLRLPEIVDYYCNAEINGK